MNRAGASPAHMRRLNDFRRVQIGIVGAGPAGLLLAYLLHRAGLRVLVLESKSREYLEQSPHRIRAGVLEAGTREILLQVGLGSGMLRSGMPHAGIHLAFDGALHRLDFPALTGEQIMVYGQQFLVRDLIAAFLEAQGEILFEHEALALEELSGRPRILYRAPEGEGAVECDFVVGADGSHSLLRRYISGARLYQRAYPFAWLGILAETPPASEELIYVSHPRGFALFSMRSPTLSRNYLQVPADEDLSAWPPERIWEELQLRLGEAVSLRPGPLLERSLTPLRSFVLEPMQHERLFLAGDAAHVVPPTGAKGMNLAFCDVVLLYRAFVEYYQRDQEVYLQRYSQEALGHVWQAEFFSWWMTRLLHTLEDPFEERLRPAQLRQLSMGMPLRTFLAENYVGMYTSLPKARLLKALLG